MLRIIIEFISFRRYFSQQECIAVPRLDACEAIRFASASPTRERHSMIAFLLYEDSTVVTEGYELPLGVTYFLPLSVVICLS
jgi:hypothetical protein